MKEKSSHKNAVHYQLFAFAFFTFKSEVIKS